MTDLGKLGDTIKNKLEAPEVLGGTKVYVTRYYLNEEGSIIEEDSIRSDIEKYINEVVPNRYPDREITYLPIEDDCARGEIRSFYNGEDKIVDICFSMIVRDAGTQGNQSDKPAIDVKYMINFEARLK